MMADVAACPSDAAAANDYGLHASEAIQRSDLLTIK